MKHPFNQRMAGQDWFEGFMSRHPEISIRSPEGMSANRARAFNRMAIGLFFDNMERHMPRNPCRIFNVDETGVTNVAKCPKIIAQEGKKRVAAATSAERAQIRL